MTINLILQSATKSVNPPVKAFSLGDGYEQTHSTAIADTEIWTVSTIPLDDDDANDLETALNALQGDTFTWIPPYGSSGDYRLNSKITRTMVGYRRSVLQFSLRKITDVQGLTCTPRTLTFVDGLTTLWERAYFDNYDGGFGEGTVAEAEMTIVAGGNSGNCARIQLDFGGVNGSGVIAFWQSPYYYTPTTADEILTFTYSEDHKFVSGEIFGHNWYFCVMQNGILKAKFGGTTGTNTSWTTHTLTATASELGLTIIPFVPIYFGILRDNYNEPDVSTIYSNIALIDNWSVVVTVSCP